MAVKHKFTCTDREADFFELSAKGNAIQFSGQFNGTDVYFRLDIPTAIKAAKTLRTEINKVKGI